MSDVTQILNAIEQGDPHAAEATVGARQELRKIRTERTANKKPGHTFAGNEAGP